MSSYGHFGMEVKTKNGWKRLTWKSDKKDTCYNYEDNELDGDDYVHKYVTVGQYYSMRDSLRYDDFGNTGMADDFTEETKKDLERFTAEYGWYEGYFYLSDLSALIVKKKMELEDYKRKNLLQAVYDEVREIKAEIKGSSFEKPKDEDNPFSEYYDSDLEMYEDEIEMLNHLHSIFSFMADECFSFPQASDIRIIVVGG